MITSTPQGICIDVRVLPRAARAGIAGTRGDALLVRLNAPPVEGAANAELIQLLSRRLGVPKRAVTIIGGHRSRQKRVAVTGLTREQAAHALLVSGSGEAP